MRKLVVLVLGAVTVLWPATCLAQADGPKLEVDPGDKPLVITGFIAEDGTFSGTVRLHALESITTLRALFTDLKSQHDPTENIPRSRLSLSGVDALSKDDYVDATVTVTGVTVAGRYEGELDLLPAGVARDQATTVPIKLNALVHPTLTPIAPQDRVRGGFAHCGFNCDLTGFLVPGSAGSKSQSVRFSVSDRQRPTVRAIHVIGTGSDAGHQLTPADLGLSTDPDEDVAQNGDILSLKIEIDPGPLPADHYTGTVRLSFDEVDAPVTVPIDFTVRNEPLGAIVALFAGILLGRLTQFMQGRGGDLLKAHKRAALLERRVHQIDDDAQRTALLEKLANARLALEGGDLALATTLLNEVDTRTGQAIATPTLAQEAAGGQGSATPPQWVRTLSPVSTGELSLASHVLGLVLLLGVLVVGFETLYFNEGTTFGAHGVFDLVALVLWGLSADIASRGLGNLAGGQATTG